MSVSNKRVTSAPLRCPETKDARPGSVYAALEISGLTLVGRKERFTRLLVNKRAELLGLQEGTPIPRQWQDTKACLAVMRPPFDAP